MNLQTPSLTLHGSKPADFSWLRRAANFQDFKTRLFIYVYETTKRPYQRFKRNQPWPLDLNALVAQPDGSLGHALGTFLHGHGFALQPQFEDHDVVHVLTGTGVSVIEEIGMQYLLLGNGKRSVYQMMVLAAGLVFYPGSCSYFLRCYRRGKRAHRFYDLKFERLLDHSLELLQETFTIKP